MLTISEFKKLYQDIKNFPRENNDFLAKDLLKNTFVDFFSMKFKDSNTIFIKFDWEAVYRVKYNLNNFLHLI